MPTGWSPQTATALMEAARGGTPFQIVAHWIQLHSGDPGAGGVAVIPGLARQIATFTADLAVPGQIKSSIELNWTNWQGTSPPTHFTSWSESEGGAVQLSGLLTVTTAPAPGATFTLPAGALTARETVMS